MSDALDLRAREVLPEGPALARFDAAVWDLRRRRDVAAAACPDFEALRDHAAQVRRHALSQLGPLLERFEEKARAAGAHVHWVEETGELGPLVHGLLRERGATRVVKSKSMLTEECGLNPYLQARGVEVVDTDLGERIVQLARERPSHLMVPAIHKTREDVGALFHRALGTPEGESDPERLTRAARRALRPGFLEADAAVTGVNFAVADTGTLAVVTNEGNADLGTALAPLHVACLGIEKVIPSLEDLAVLLRLLARSATGQPLSAYTSLWTGPRPGGEVHVVLVDGGRSRLLGDARHRDALACIRCGACLNTCPVYRRAGGHAYAGPLPGPIGAVLAPARDASRAGAELPRASSLCGSCSAVCPVRIDLHDQLLAWRHERPAGGRGESWLARAAGVVLARPRLYRAAGRLARAFWPLLARPFRGNPATPWLEGRELPPHPGPSFRTYYRRYRRAAPDAGHAAGGAVSPGARREIR